MVNSGLQGLRATPAHFVATLPIRSLFVHVTPVGDCLFIKAISNTGSTNNLATHRLILTKQVAT